MAFRIRFKFIAQG